MQPRWKGQAPKVMFSRELPGGGYVTIQVQDGDGAPCRGRITVERRSDLRRRDGESVPIIAEREGLSAELVYESLLEIATDNVAVARAIRAWEAANPASSD
jgi:hypothetical protein